MFWMCVIIAVTQLGFGAVVPVLPLYAKSFGVSVSAIGLSIAVYGLARFASAIPCGFLADRLGRQPTLALGGLVSAIGNFWCGWADTYPEFLLARFVAGAGAAMVLTMGTVIVADISPPHRRGRMMAIYQGVFLFSFGIGPLPGGVLAEHIGLSAPFYVYGWVSVIGCLLAWFVIPETRNLAQSRPGATTTPPLPFIEQLRALSRSIGFVLIGILSFASSIGRTGALFALVPLVASEKIGLSASEVGVGFALSSVIGLIVSYPAGSLSDRFGRKVVIVPAMVLNGLSMVAFAAAPSLFGFMAANILWGTAAAISSVSSPAYAADVAPSGMNAAALSSFRMIGDLGYVLGPMLLGVLADLWSAEAALWATAVFSVAIAALFGRMAPETVRRAGR